MSIDDATAFISQAVIGAQQRYIPTSVPRCRWPTVWWNRYCHQAFRAKMRAWESGDQIGYQRARRIARRIQAKALADYKKKVLEKLSHGSNDRVWWKMTRSLSGLSKPSRRAAPNVDVLGGFFASKFSLSDDFAA